MVMRIIGNDPQDPGAPPTGVDAGTGKTRAWALGLYTVGNYPAVVQFHEDRLCLAGCPSQPERVDMSNSGIYETFSPSAVLDGTVTDDSALAFALNSNEVNAIRWLQSDQNGLLIGTAGGEWLMSSAFTNSPLTPTSVSAHQSTQHGSQPIAPVRVGVDTMFVQIGGKILRQMVYNYYINGFQGANIAFRAEHLAAPGIIQVARQRTPQPLIWLVRADGKLASVLYEPTEQQHPQDCGWALQFDYSGISVQSIAVIPSVDTSRDELWLAVTRTLPDGDHTYIERMSKLWEEGDATPFTLNGESGYHFTPSLTTYLDSAQRTVFGSAVTNITGLDHLEGMTVGVLVDGATHPDVVVTSGAITLDAAALDVNVGLKYTSRARTMHVEAGAADGTAMGKKKRIWKVVFRLFSSLGFKVLPNGTGGQLTDVEPFRSTADLMDSPPPLFSGDYNVDWEGTYETEGFVEFLQDDPLPLNVSSVVLKLETMDDD